MNEGLHKFNEHVDSLDAQKWGEALWKEVSVLGDGLITKIRERDGFSMVAEFSKKQKPFIEIAGRTEEGYPFYVLSEDNPPKEIDISTIKKVFTSNLYRGVPYFSGDGGVTFERPVDFRADATDMPLQENSVDGVFCACLGTISSIGVRELHIAYGDIEVPFSEIQRTDSEKENLGVREAAIKEAYRVLQPGGFLIWIGTEDDLTFAQEIGFTALHIEEQKPEQGSITRYKAILAK